MEVRWLDDALADVAEIYRYVATDDRRATARVVERVQAAVRRLNDAAHHGRPARWPGSRELVVPRTPYIVPYRVAGDHVEILRVFHGARRWPQEPSDSREHVWNRGRPASCCHLSQRAHSLDDWQTFLHRAILTRLSTKRAEAG
jgi:toxin ParE1/3/4